MDLHLQHLGILIIRECCQYHYSPIFGTIRSREKRVYHPTNLRNMAENFDSLHVLLKMVEPGLSSDQLSALTAQLDEDQWQALIAEADRQNITPYLYTLLVNLNISYGMEIPQREKLNQLHLSNTVRNMLIMHDVEIILRSLQKAGVPAAGLKGIYLLENIYPDIGARSMNDIDLLVRKPDLPICLAVMGELGYQPNTYFNLADKNIDTKHVPPMKKESGPLVELHWTLLEEDEPFTIDAEALWERIVPATIAIVDARALSVEDLILHLSIHLTYQHYLNLGLRGLMDIALVIHKFRSKIDWQKLVQIARSWGSERVTALTLKLVESQLNVSIPAEVIPALLPEGIDPIVLENARRQLLERVWFDDHFTPDLLELSSKKGFLAKIKIGLQRVFIPRLALARTYNVPPNSPKILGLYWVRLQYLIRSYGKTLLRLQRGEAGTEPARQKAEISNSLHEWMTSRKK